jgi:hypothetical protein
MTDVEILTKAIDRAVANGWLGIRDHGYRYDGAIFRIGSIRVDAFLTEKKSWSFDHFEQFIFSREFAKAFFGEGEHDWVSFVRCSICQVDYEATETNYCWEYYLNEMALDPHPLKYLEGFL